MHGSFALFQHTVVAELEKRLGKKLKVTPVLVSAQTRIPTIISGAIDMECGATTNNASRQKEVDFATTTYVEEVRVAVRADSCITSVDQLAGKTVATTAGTTSVTLLRKHQRAKNVELKEVLIYPPGRARSKTHSASTHLWPAGVHGVGAWKRHINVSHSCIFGSCAACCAMRSASKLASSVSITMHSRVPRR